MSTTQLERDNVDLVRRGYEAFAQNDVAGLTELFDAGAVWHSVTTGILAGTYHGRDAIFAMFGQLQRETSGTFRAMPNAFAACGDKVFVETEATGERLGRSLYAREVLTFTLAGGHVREVRVYTEDYPAVAAFWA